MILHRVKKCHLFVGRIMVKKIAFPSILTVFHTYFLATAIISDFKEETLISLKSKNTNYLEKILCVELIIRNILKQESYHNLQSQLQSRASEFIREKIFHGERPPEFLRRRFNPNRKKVRNLITRVKLETHHSKIDQENVEWARGN